VYVCVRERRIERERRKGREGGSEGEGDGDGGGKGRWRGRGRGRGPNTLPPTPYPLHPAPCTLQPGQRESSRTFVPVTARVGETSENGPEKGAREFQNVRMCVYICVYGRVSKFARRETQQRGAQCTRTLSVSVYLSLHQSISRSLHLLRRLLPIALPHPQ
jgi:hypothetical protein